jgi:hypothetical protein
MDGILTEFVGAQFATNTSLASTGVAHYFGKPSRAYQLLGLVRLEVRRMIWLTLAQTAKSGIGPLHPPKMSAGATRLGTQSGQTLRS